MDKKKVFNVIATVLTWVLALFTIFMVVMIILNTVITKNDKPLFGYRAYTVLTDSMKDTFEAGDIVICKDVDPADLEVGDIISFQCTDRSSDVYGEIITHKIKAKAVEDGVPVFVTYGTTTGAEDEERVAYNFVKGKYVTNIPNLGSFLSWLKTPWGYILMIGLPFMGLIAIEIVQLVKNIRLYRKEAVSEVRAEKEELLAQREENLRMMEEIKKMKEELEKAKAESSIQADVETGLDSDNSSEEE